MLLTFKALVNHLAHSIPEILAAEWHAHSEEVCTEYWLLLRSKPLGVGQVCHSKVVRTIMKQNTDLRVIRKVLAHGGKEKSGMHQSSSTKTGNSCWPHSPVKKSCFSAFNAFSKKVHHLWEKKNRNGHDKALRVTRGTRELRHQLQKR